MNQLSLYRCLDLNKPAVTSFTGGGGKTSLIRRLAEEFNDLRQKVLLTTTTKCYPFPNLPHFYLDSSVDIFKKLSEHYKNNNIAVLGGKIGPDGKIAGISPKLPGSLTRELGIHVLVEADGSKGKPLKGYEKYEPVVPSDSDLIVSVIGADALGAPVEENIVHRSGIFQQAMLLSDSSTIIDENLLAQAFSYMEQVAVNQAPHARFIYVLNKFDILNNPNQAYKIACVLKKMNNNTSLISTKTNSKYPVKMYLNALGQPETASLTCVILAAGSSERMGSADKLTLPFKQSTVLQSTLDQVISSGISEIIIVTAPGSRWKSTLADCNLRIVENPLNKTGQASSLKAGLEEVNPKSQGVIFALGDQPLIGSDIFKMLIDRYKSSLKPVTYPVYQNRRGNPVIFDRTLWPLLMKLEGDEGGRAIIKNLGSEDIDLVQTDNKYVITDIDTPEDYKAALKMNDIEP